MIPVEAIEAALATWMTEWDEPTDGLGVVIRERVQQALESAAPYIREKALQDAAAALAAADCWSTSTTSTDHVQRWLTTRASNQRTDDAV